jgi:hypothetical protein
VEGALSAADAISTHGVLNEVDYFTAVDDLPRGAGTAVAEHAETGEETATGKGSAHVDEAQFASACFYKYFSLDLDQLVSNLTPKGGDDKAKAEAKRLAAATVGHFIIAAARTTPTGKQHSHAAFNAPSGILVEKKETKTPTSYANAFAEPARRIGVPPDDAADELSLVGRSIAQLGDFVHSHRNPQSEPFWYSPELWRYPLRGWEREPDGQRRKDKGGNPKAIPLTGNCHSSLGDEPDKPGLVQAVIGAISLKWSDVKDAGKKTAETKR